MEFGVTIRKGATPWQIFQQQEGSTDIRVSGEYHCVRLSQELPLEFSPIEGKAAVIKARIAWEDSGESVIPWQVCESKAGEGNGGTWETVLRDVPAGGLYRIETYMEYEGWDGLSCTRGDMVHYIGVGDIWVITGQSNAAGRSKNPVEDPPELGVHLLRPNGCWDLASHPMSEATNAVHLGHYANHNPGHSPWLHFAKLLKKQLGYPIGLVNCAYGGAPLRWWNPDENGALFENMLTMLGDFDIVPKGILWCQGETECYQAPGSGASYLERFHRYVEHTRKAMGNPNLPFILVQVNRFLRPCRPEDDHTWGLVREAHRRAMHVIPHTYTIPSNDCSLYDTGHDSSEGNLVIGERCAKCALAEVYGLRRYDWRAPEAVCAKRVEADVVLVEFQNVRVRLQMYEMSPELLPFTAEDADGLVEAAEYQTEETALRIQWKRPLGPGAVIHGCWKMNSGAYVPYDCMRMPMLSFYGLPVK